MIEKSIEDMVNKQMLQKIYLHEFTEPQLKDDISLSGFKNGISIEDQKFLKVMKENTVLVNGHYQIPLPLKDPDVKFPNNRKQVEKQLEGLEKRFKRDQKFFQQYKQFMEDMIGNGYADKCKIEGKEGRCWCLSNHGVYHPQNPGKNRVVFDCSAQYAIMSIKTELMSELDLAKQIVSVLLRFRKEHVAFMADIKSMFYQVLVPPHQRSLLHYLWWEESNLSKKVFDYQMCTHIFRGTSSSSCSNCALKKAATDNSDNFCQEAAKTLL